MIITEVACRIGITKSLKDATGCYNSSTSEVGLKATVESTDNVDEVIKQLQHKAYEKVSKKFFG